MSKGFAAILAAVVTTASLFAAPALLPFRAVAPAGQSDLDALMEKVLARRDENWKKLQQYVLDEREQMEIRTFGDVPIWGERREYTWYLRDGFFVRSPLKVNGVTVAEDERRKYESDYLQGVKERETRRGKGGVSGFVGFGPTLQVKLSIEAADPVPAPQVPDPAPGGAGAPQDVQSLILQTRQPAFVGSAYFLWFKFERAKYALVGRETVDGRDVLRIEYYPARLFSRAQDQQQGRQQENKSDREKDVDATLERLMNKVALVTIWVEPKSYQIVKYTLDNVNLDFLPAAWLLHVDATRATMTMSQPFPDVWLPRDVQILVSATMAIGSFDIRYRLDYHDYRKAETSSRIKTPSEWR